MRTLYSNDDVPLDFHAAVISNESGTRARVQNTERPKFLSTLLAIKKFVQVATVFSRR